MLETIIKEHEETQALQQKKEHKDTVDILLSCLQDSHLDEQNPVKDRTNIKALLLDLFAGAIDTSVTVTLWVFSRKNQVG